MMQVLANALVSASLFALVGLGFALLYQTERFFNLFLGLTITGGAYAMLVLAESCNLPLVLAVPVAVLLASAGGTTIASTVTRPLRQAHVPAWGLLIVTLGLYTILQNALSLVFGDNTRTVRTGAIGVGYKAFGALVTEVQLITLVLCVAAFIALFQFLEKTSLGRAIRGVSSNAELCGIVGIEVERTILWAVAIGSALAALGGVLSALDTDMTPSMGFRLLLNGVIVFIIGGVGSYRGLMCGALLLGLGQHVVAYCFDSKWMDAVAFLILIVFLLWKPLGFGGRQLKKVEV